jgi:NAD+ kinase
MNMITAQGLLSAEGQYFDRHYVSEYIRAQETAARMNFPNARWFSEVFLRERDWGQMDLMSWGERVEKMGSELQRKELDRFLFAPPGGESMADVAFRTNTTIRQLHRECADRRVIIVCHGEVMWAMRTQLERMSIHRYRDLSSSRRVTDRIHNGQILWYSRRDPDTGKVSPFFTHYMSVCPWDTSRSTNQWEKIERSIYTNGMLLAMAEQVCASAISYHITPDITFCDIVVN